MPLTEDSLEALSIDYLAQWLQEWLGHTGEFHFFKQARRRGWLVRRRTAKYIIEICKFSKEMKKQVTLRQSNANLRKGKGLWEVWQVDHIGPLCRTPRGWTYILTGVEGISGIGMVHPGSMATALATSAGLDHCFTILPLPQETRSENGSHFKIKGVQDWCER